MIRSCLALSLSVLLRRKETQLCCQTAISKVPSRASHVLLPEIAPRSGLVFAIAVFEGVVRNKVKWHSSSFIRELGVSLCIGLEDVSAAIGKREQGRL